MKELISTRELRAALLVLTVAVSFTTVNTATVELESSTVSVVEGQRFVEVVILKSIVTEDDVTITVVLVSMTAEGGLDYGPFPISIPRLRLTALIASNETRINYGIPITDDSIVEHTETFRVELESPDDGQVTIGSLSSAVVTIVDDDFVEFVLALREGALTVVEGNTRQLLFNVTKVGVAVRDVSIVILTQDGTAFAPGDYTPLSFQLTFEPNEIVKEFTIDINQDMIVEATEVFSLTFEPSIGETGVQSNDNITMVTILDDDDVVSVGLSSDLSSVDEGTTALMTVLSSGNNEIPVTVAIAISNASTAVDGTDYVFNVSTLTFEPGVTSITVPLVAISDGRYESDSESLILIGQPGDGETRVQINAESAEATIEIEDRDSVTIGFSGDELIVGESRSTINVTVQLAEGQLDVGVVVLLMASGDLAEKGVDFRFDDMELTFEPNGPTSLTVSIDIMDDQVFEGREGFFLQLTSPDERVNLNPEIKEVLIVDNEDLVISFSSTVYSVEETDSSLEVEVQLGPGIQLQRPISLDLRTSNGAPPTGASGGSDFEVVNATLTFRPGVTTATYSVILLDDEISEGLENFDLQVVLVDEALGDPGVILSSSVVIFDNEDIFVSLSSSEYVVNEGAGFVVMAIEKSGITPNNEVTEVLLTFSDGTALGGTDYGPFPIATPTTNLTAILSSNQTETLFGIPVTNDNLVEDLETFFVTLQLIGGRSKEEGGIVFLGDVTMATVTIEDNDMVNVSLIIGESEVGVVNVEEGRSHLNFSIVRSDSVTLGRVVTMVVTTTAGTAEASSDFVMVSEMMIEFAPGIDETQEVSFPVMLLDDAVAEGNEMFTVELSTTDPNVFFSVDRVKVTVVDNDVAEIEFVSSMYEAFEADRSVTVCLRKSADTAFSFMVTLRPIEATAVPEDTFTARANADFDATPKNVTFEPTTREACTSITVFQDLMPGESLEVFTVLFDLPSGVPALEIGPQATADVFVTDIPDVIVGFQSSEIVQISEDENRVEVCVAVLNPATDEVLETTLEVFVQTVQGTADVSDFFPITPGSLVLTLNNIHRSNCFFVRIRDDDLFEDPPTENFTIIISNVTSSNADLRLLLSLDSVTMEIVDDDRSVTIGFEQMLYDVPEENTSLNICIVVSTPALDQTFTAQPINLLVTTIPGSADESDYTSLTNFPIGQVSNDVRRVCFTVEVENDEMFEGPEDESFSVTLDVQVAPEAMLSVTLTPSIAIISILDDDRPPTTTEPPEIVTPPEVSTTSTPPTSVVRGNDTIIGDPLYSVPLYVQTGIESLPHTRNNDLLHLCYEIHGEPDSYFNLVSDTCTNINAHYTSLLPDTEFALGLNVISTIGIQAVNLNGECVRVELDAAKNCTPIVSDNGRDSMPGVRYSKAGISVNRVRNRVRVALPNCGTSRRLVMWLTCETEQMLRFDLARGVQLSPTSHGLLGQFWSVPISIQKYVYNSTEATYLETDQLYLVTVDHPNADKPRSFVAEYDSQLWDTSKKECVYAGNVQGGRLAEIDDNDINNSVIEGSFMDYTVDSLFDHSFIYSQFDADMCLL